MADMEFVVKALREYDGEPLTFMEVCGTHTAAIIKSGIPSMLSPKIKLVSGPGCPVCVTVAEYIDRLAELSLSENTTVVSFGDMLRVPGSRESLKDASARGGSVRMVYSPLEILDMAESERQRLFVFAAVGFETTAPLYAVMLEEAIKRKIKNIRLLTALKTMPAAIEFLCNSQSGINGFLAPGHVAVITGADMFRPIAEKYSVPFVVSGFEGRELLASIYALTKLQGRGEVRNLYKRAVSDFGNEAARNAVEKFFEPCDAVWRGIGRLGRSGIALKKEYEYFDMGSRNIVKDGKINTACRCGEVILGSISPSSCPLFRSLCTPENPQGSCMVSCEGACYNYFINNRG